MAQGSGDEVGPAHWPRRQPGRLGHRLDHDALQGAVPHLAQYEASEKIPFGFRRPCHQRGEELDAPPARSRTGGLPHGLEAGVGVGQGQGGTAGIRTREGILQHGPADADPALGQLTAQVRHRDGNLPRLQPAQTFGQVPDLGQPARVAGDLGGEIASKLDLEPNIWFIENWGLYHPSS